MRSAEGEASHAEETQEIGDNVEKVFPYLPRNLGNHTRILSIDLRSYLGYTAPLNTYELRIHYITFSLLKKGFKESWI